MSTDSGQSGVFDTVSAHVSGELRVDSPIEHRAAPLTNARTISRVGGDVARAPPAARSPSIHARRS